MWYAYAFAARVRAARIERRRLALRHFRRRAEHLRRRSLVEPGVEAQLAHRLEHADRPHAGHGRRVLRNVERHADMRLGAEIVDLVRAGSILSAWLIDEASVEIAEHQPQPDVRRRADPGRGGRSARC